MANTTKFTTPVKARIEGKLIPLMTRKVVETPDGARCTVKLKNGRFATLTRSKKAKVFQIA